MREHEKEKRDEYVDIGMMKIKKKERRERDGERGRERE